MQLVVIAKGSDWSVYAVCSDETTCPLLDFISELDQKRGDKVMSDLREFVPFSTPQQWVATKFSWSLRDTEILEFRWKTKKGGTPRVHWFYDENRVIVCTHGVNKKGETAPQDIKAAEVKKAEYLKQKAAGQLQFVALDEFDPPDEEESDNG
jgi:hypothetical protein